MLDPNMNRLAQILTQERLTEAAAARERAQTWERAAGLLNRLAVTLSRQLIRLGQVVQQHEMTPQEKRGHVW